ncbi:uncharacterized protein LOC130914907 [Corythoichthys intestinalis]|uniref:uncharacterized protein LOC130914907 n=1 Tax=Corythoichthys intestinalis TaxID=161448 RepID=UPI0025A5D535|nr:uncharacterized protein LOC130914907 [Corythoichthys intestinalis]XP_057690479.1 uncharacterized protein LOC130914907 [Corythoichthys intestinalis]
MRKNIFLLLLPLIHIITPLSAQNTTTTSTTNTSAEIFIRPVDVSVFVGDPATFICAVPETSPIVTFALFGDHGNYSLTCPGERVEDIPQDIYGRCYKEKGLSLAVWNIKGTSNSDNHTKVVCQLPNGGDSSTAILYVHDNGRNLAILVGCVIGAFFGSLLVFALLFLLLQRSEAFQKCFSGRGRDDDAFTIISKDFTKQQD